MTRTSRLGPFSFYKQALVIALPVMLQQLVMSMVSLVDNFMVAGLGDVSMASVNVANHLFFVYMVIINTVCQAGGIYLAQFSGAKDRNGMQHSYRFKVVFALVCAAVYFTLARTIPHLMIGMMTNNNAAQDLIVESGSLYLRLIAWTFFPFAISSSIATSFREIGNPKVPLYISGAVVVINTFLNWVLIYGNLGAPRLEIIGAAYSTIFSRCLELALFWIYAARTKAPFFVGLTKLFALQRKLVTEILAKSGMIFVSELSWILSETVMVAMYNRRGGAEIVSGMAAGWAIANMFFLLFGGIWIAAAVLIGGSLGEGKLDEARSRAKWLQAGSVVAAIAIAIPGALAAHLLIPIVFSALSAEAQRTSLHLVWVILAYLPLWGILNVRFAVTRAGGDVAAGMHADLWVTLVLILPGAVLLSYFTAVPPVPMFALLKLTDFAKYFIIRHYQLKERWVKNLTVDQ